MKNQFTSVLVGAFLLEAAGYLAFPFLSIALRDSFGMPESQIGLVFLFAIGLRPVWAILGGYLAERIRPVFLFSAACLLESAAFFLLGFSDNLVLGSAAIVLGNVGFSLWTPNLFALVYKLFPAGEATAKVSLLNGALNTGAAVGCLLGGAIASVATRDVFIGAAALYLVSLPLLGRALWAEVPELSKETPNEAPRASFVLKPVLGISLITFGFWGSYAQFNSFFALYSKDWLNSATFAGVAFALLAISVAALSFLLSRQPVLLKRVGFLSCASALLLMAAWQLLIFSHWVGAVLFVIALAAAESTISLLLVERWAAVDRQRKHLMQSLNFAGRNIAMGIGSFIGGSLYHAPAGGPISAWPWSNAVLLAVCVVGFVFWREETH